MAYNNNAKKPHTQKQDKPVRAKPVTVGLPLVVTGKTPNGVDYSVESLNKLVGELQDCGCFTKLSVMATMAKSVLFNKDDARGTATVARITAFNTEDGNMSLLFFGKNVDLADRVKDMVVVPRVRLAHNSDEVETVLSFELVNAMEA